MIWKIEARDDVQCLDLASFTIGAAPKGFEEVVTLPPNLKGLHTLVVRGIGYGATTLTL